MAYTAPDLSTLRSAVARDLRDPDLKTFTAQELNDLINLGVVEVGRVYSKQDVQELTVESDGQQVYACDAIAIFRVELLKDSVIYYGVPQNADETSGEGGWDLHGGNLYIPKTFASHLAVENSPTVRVWGYWPRELFSEDTDVLDGDAETEFAVRTVATLNGYQRLQNDRLLFQQWLTNTGNSDVSPNQLAQTADLYQSQWREMRNRLRNIQRS